MGLEIVAPMVMGLGFFALLAFVTHAIVDGRRRRERLKVVTEFHNRLLDKIGSASDLTEFFDSDGGTRFLNTMGEDRGAAGPKQRLLSSLQYGLVLTVLGAGMLGLGRMYAIEEGGFTILGIIIGSIGVGFLLSTAASYRLAGSLGLLEDGPHGPAARQ